jgi:hypothetical protein
MENTDKIANNPKKINYLSENMTFLYNKKNRDKKRHASTLDSVLIARDDDLESSNAELVWINWTEKRRENFSEIFLISRLFFRS